MAAQIKIQLEHARKHVAQHNTNVQEENVILTRTDAKGIFDIDLSPRVNEKKRLFALLTITRLIKMCALGTVRPTIQPRNQSKRENDRKKKIAETHISGERVRHFVDDDKYSLQEMVSYRNEITSILKDFYPT